MVADKTAKEIGTELQEGNVPTPSAHTPSVIGSVLEASNGVGGNALIRLQNMSATSKAFRNVCIQDKLDVSDLTRFLPLSQLRSQIGLEADCTEMP